MPAAAPAAAATFDVVKLAFECPLQFMCETSSVTKKSLRDAARIQLNNPAGNERGILTVLSVFDPTSLNCCTTMRFLKNDTPEVAKLFEIYPELSRIVDAYDPLTTVCMLGTVMTERGPDGESIDGVVYDDTGYAEATGGAVVRIAALADAPEFS
jgi:hypothetical protein